MDPLTMALGLGKAYFEFLVTPQGQLVAADALAQKHDVHAWIAGVIDRLSQKH